MNRYVRLAISLLVTVLVGLGAFYFWLPALNIQSQEFWIFILLLILTFGLFFGVLKKAETVVVVGSGKNQRVKKTFLRKGHRGIVFLDSISFNKVYFIIVLIPIAVLVIGSLFSSIVFNAKGFSQVITVTEHEFEKDMPEVEYISNIALMDTDSAKKLGDRELGALAKVVSQFRLSEEYTQINYQGTPQKVAHLDYDGFFKWMSNSNEGIPGYVMVDAVKNSAKYVELDKKMKYSDGAYFGDDLYRAVRFAYPTKIIGNFSFEVDENGEVFYVISCLAPKVGLFGAYDVSEVILFDPVDGSHELLSLDAVPSWVDIVYDGYLACEKYDWQGIYAGGFLNSFITKQGCKKTTADFGYIMRDDDVWYFTGVTSVTADASNIGFILSNARTGEYKFYPVVGAEEFSAMGSAEGEVQEKRYTASFPSLVNIMGEPTYIMVLKDDIGAIRLYALVNVEQYNIVATGVSQDEAKKLYKERLVQNGIVEVPATPEPTVELKTETVTVEKIDLVSIDGNTVVYIKDTKGNLFKMNFTEENEEILLVDPSDKLKITYVEGATSNVIYSFKPIK